MTFGRSDSFFCYLLQNFLFGDDGDERGDRQHVVVLGGKSADKAEEEEEEKRTVLNRGRLRISRHSTTNQR